MGRFAETLSLLRQHHQLTQLWVANKLGVSRSHISHIERAGRSDDTPSHELVLAVSQLFGVTTDFLLRPGWPIPEIDQSQLRDHVEVRQPPRLVQTKLRFLRSRAGYSQSEVASGIGVGRRSTISLVETRRLGSLDLLVALADFFGVTTDWLLDDSQSIDLPVSVPISYSAKARPRGD